MIVSESANTDFLDPDIIFSPGPPQGTLSIFRPRPWIENVDQGSEPARVWSVRYNSWLESAV